MTRTIPFRRSLLPLWVALALTGCASDLARREGQSLIGHRQGLPEFMILVCGKKCLTLDEEPFERSKTFWLSV